MAALSDFLSYIVPYVSKCPDIVIAQAVLKTIRDFCLETWIWQDSLDAILIVDGVLSYDFDIPSNAQIVGICSVKNSDIDIVDKVDIDIVQNLLTLHSNHGLSGFVDIKAALSPSFTATTVPDFFLNRFMPVVLSGTVSNLCSVPGKSWSDYDMAAHHEGLYNNEISRYKIRRNKMYSSQNLKVKGGGFI